MTIQQANQRLLFYLYKTYDDREAANIADWVMEHLTGWKKIDRVIFKENTLTPQKADLVEKYGTELALSRPVQYVLQEAWFYGMKLFVDENVLIPRPETEELAEWVIDAAQEKESVFAMPNGANPGPCMLDIGTGSGCLAIALKKKFAPAHWSACDLSAGALAVAARNAADLNAPIDFIQLDFTDPQSWSLLRNPSLIVSNPPYIPLKEEASMPSNVTRYEPRNALFVSNDDPLVFYKAIADFADQKLLPGGNIFVETHENFARETAQVFISKGYLTEIRKDMQGKERMLRCRR